MNLTRRQMLCVIAASLLSGCAEVPPPPPKSVWRERTRLWMQALIPDDAEGPGADCPEVWAMIDQRLEEDSKFSEWLISGMNQDSMSVPPVTVKALEKRRQKEDFVDEFLDLLIKCYYGCATGWGDLGLVTPPQPTGFVVL